MRTVAGKVYLVGAGPGLVDMLTVRAHELICTASCLLHDDLVGEEVLALARPDAIVRHVGKRCGPKTITQEDINHWMIEYARAGHSVVRLKSGDPLLFGRAVEEIGALRAAGVDCERVPGISSGVAAAALAGTPLTGRVSNSRVVFATRHLAAGETNGLRGIGPEGTLVLYMPGRNYAAIAGELVGNGWPEGTECHLASCLGTGGERRITCTLAELASVEVLQSPVVMLFFAQGERDTWTRKARAE